MTNKSNNLINDALSVATAVAYTKKEVDKLSQRIDSLSENKQEVIVEYVQGPAGEQGPSGADGRDGVDGLKGDKGDKGDRGDRGPEGLPGLSIKGEKGDRGEQGPAGADGRDGINGTDGKNGVDGKDGTDGRDGINGTDGKNGIDGKDGINGRDGVDGTNGIDGRNGLDGRDGVDGKNGQDGKQGLKGDKGDKGDRGEDGKDANIKPIEDKFKKFQDVIEKDLQQYKNRINASVSKAMATDAWKATGSGEVNLRYLDDVDRDSITDGYVLSYNESTKKFTFIEQTGGSGSVGTLQQVTIAGNTTTRGMTTSTLAFNLTSANTVTTGQMAWNAADLSVDLGLSNGVTMQLGQSEFIKVKAANNISIGQTAMFAGADGEHILATPCNTRIAGFVEEWFIGVAPVAIAKNGFGYIQILGKIEGLNTLAFTVGDILYADPTVVGGLTKTEPEAPEFNIVVAAVTKRAGGDGHLLVRPTFRSTLGQLNDVTTKNLLNDDLLKYVSANSRWENVTLSSVVGPAFSTANSATTLAQSAYDQANTPQTQLVNGSDTLSLDGSSKVNLPGGTSYIFSATNNITLAPDNTGNNYLEIINNTGATISTDRGFEVRTNADGTDRVWTFTQGGSLFFPDSTYQTTAFTGTAIDSLARTTANNAYSQANTATTNASTADTKASNAWSTANSAYSQANTATTNAASANTIAQAAYDKANTAITTSGGTATGSITANSTTAFIAGDAAISGVALQVPSEGALRNLTNGSTNMYFDVSIGGTSQGQFQFRSSSSYTNILTMSPTGVTFNTDATFTSRTPSLARTAFNSAIDTEITVDSMRFRISNQGGIFPQVIGNSSSRNLAWTSVGAVNGSAINQVGSTGTIVASNAWTTLYNLHGMDSAGDTITVTLQDKAAGRIYRITFMRSDNGSTTGYNIIGERLL